MSVVKTWNMGQDSETIKQIIDTNFVNLSRYAASQIKTLSYNEMLNLSDGYKRESLLVFNIDDYCWYVYRNGKWNPMSLSVDFVENDWRDGTIEIISGAYYNSNMSIQVFRNDNDNYTLVFPDIEIDHNNNVVLKSDIRFKGRAVIK